MFFMVLALVVVSGGVRHWRMDRLRENRAVHQQKMGAPRMNGVVRLQHGSFQCLGALLKPEIVLTCCICVSDVFFSCSEDSDQVTYEVRALTAENITIKSEDNVKVPGKDVFIHPQCDIDGTYDYGIIILGHGIGRQGDAGECFMALFNSRHLTNKPLPDALFRKRLKHSPSGICVLFTNLEDSAEGTIQQIFTQFIDWRNCWNGSETKPAFEAKYCIRTLDPGISLENGKCGSPIFCDRRLVGILARRYAIGGPNYASVNGLDGAIQFVRETVKMDIRDHSSDEEVEVNQEKEIEKIKNPQRKNNRNKRKT